MSQGAMLSVLKLTKQFGGVHAVEDVTFELSQGEALGIIGPNGSGKTTLVNLITGFVKPSSGRVTYRSHDITYMKPYKRVNLGMVRTFQLVKPFYNLPAYKNLVIPFYSHRARTQKGGGYGERKDMALDLLEEIGFERDSNVPYQMAKDLSHGYLKRLELARCLALNGELIFLDELFSGMSMAEVASVVPLLERIKDEGRTLVMIEHRVRELFRIVDKVIVLSFGKKIAEGPPKEIVNVKEVQEAYMGKGDLGA